MPNPTLDNLPLEWVRAFEAAGRTGSFTAAAQETGLTQAAISQRIGHLESRLGTQLFIRQARGVILTIEGESWLPFVTSALDTIRHSADDMFSTDRRRLTMSASASMIQLWLAPCLHQATGDLPQMTFQTMILSSDAPPQGPTVRIRYGLGDGAEHYRARLFKEEICPVAAPTLLDGAKDWRSLPRIGLSGTRPGWQDWSRHSGDPATPVPNLRFDTFACALAAARAGLGVLLASLPLCRSDLDSGALIPLSNAPLTPRQSHWMLAREDALSRKHWARLTELFVR